MAKLSLTAQVGMAASMATSQSGQFHISQDSIDELREAKRKRRLWTVVVGSVAGLTMVASLAAMAIEASTTCYVAFALPLVLAPWVIVQRWHLNRRPTIRGQIDLCREHINRLVQQNSLFLQECHRLGSEKDRLKAVDGKLQEIVAVRGGDLQLLKRLIQENSAIRQKIKGIQKAQDLQCLMQVLLTSDLNHDRPLTEDELYRLTTRLQTFDALSQARVRTALMESSMGKSVTSLYRTLEKEVCEEETTHVSTRASNFSRNDVDSDGYFTYQCMD